MARQEKRLATMSPEMLEHVAENMKERIYATLTLVAVIAVMWQNAEHHTVFGTIAGIIGTALALWLATIIAARMSYRAVHGRGMNTGHYRKLLFTSSGLLAPVIPPVLLLLISGSGIISLRTALMISMILLAFSLFLFSFMAGRKIYVGIGRLVLISALEMLLGVGVIALKIAVGE